ncbi:MAG: BMP family ABC transporter substrate-binding protein [Treponema sp.]|nr:BMP family ABC transporter substrate-binding protein [Treponema sp.]
MKKLLLLLLVPLILFSGCLKNSGSQSRGTLNVLVFVTGVTAGSPTYEMMAEGALEYASLNPLVNVKVYEAGMNQAGWEQQLAEMISGGQYDIVIGSNPSLPEICANLTPLFPNQKFIITDADYAGNPNIRTYKYNQYEQSLFLGYLAGLITSSSMPFANNEKKIGFIAAQEFPQLTLEMVPGFIEGAKRADPDIELDFRVIGSWADANKAAELASAMMNSGVDVFTSIAGGAAQGLLKTASERNAYVVWYNINAYDMAPGIIAGCGVMEQKKLIMEILDDVIAEKIQYGVSQVMGVKEGYLRFIFDDPAYYNLPADIRQKLETFIANMQ